MAFKLLEAAQDRWRRIRSPELVPLVRAGATFTDGQLQERSDNPTDQTGQNNEWCAPPEHQRLAFRTSRRALG